MKKVRLPPKLEIVNNVVAAIGITMILCSSLFTVEQGTACSKILSIVGDLGIGIFPTGIIGFALERMQNRSKEQEKREKRSAILRLFNNAVHGYLNIICNSVIKSNSDLKYQKVFDITSTVSGKVDQVSFPEEERKALALLVERLHELFGTTNPLFIVTDVFEVIEITHFEMLLNDGNALLHSIDERKNTIDLRSSFLSYLQITCSEIPECKSFSEMISDGDNIYILQV